MKLINHMFVREIGNIGKQYIIVNTLTAFVGILFKEEAEIVMRWKSEENINPVTGKETALYSKLAEHNFLINNSEEEFETVNKIMTSCRIKHREKSAGSHSLVLALTYMCNFNCPYCFEKENCNSKGKVITKEQIDRILELNSGKIKDICLFGGEPLLPYTKDIISYVFKKAPNEIYSVITNGYFLDEFIPLLKTVRTACITVTLDGKAERHNKTRILKNGSGTYDKIIRNIEIALENGLPIEIRMNLTADNKDEALALREEFKEKYAKYYTSKKLFFNLQAVFQQEATQKTQIYLDSLYTIPKDGNFASNNTSALFSYPLLKNLMSAKNTFTPLYCNCDSEESTFIYDAYDDIYSCMVALGNKHAAIGTYYPEYSLEKEECMLNRNIESIPQCKECINKFLCGGGCAYQIFKPGETIFRPNCRSMNAQIDHLIAFAKRELDKHAESAK